MTDQFTSIIENSNISPDLKLVAAKVFNNERISFDEGVLLYDKGELGFLGTLANYVKEKKHGEHVFFNRNFHVEPTNICVFTCKFCSYSRLLKQKEEGWELTEEQILDIVKSYKDKPVTEVHIVGGVHPKMNLEFFCNVFRKIKALRPDLHIKGFTAVELDYMFRKANVTVEEGLKLLKQNGLDSLPGGGAEIFDTAIRNEICGDKSTSAEWLNIHETAHRLDIPSNATMLYGHIEKYEHRIDHLEQLRQLQDKSLQHQTFPRNRDFAPLSNQQSNIKHQTCFNTFIPLKFRKENNEMSHVPEVSVVEDLRNYAISRIYLDNFEHIKAYWPMIGRTVAQLSLSYGVDDIDGTIDDSTKIYSMAGAEEQHPVMNTQQLIHLIKQAGRHPIERDTLYNVVHDYGKAEVENAVM